jgi:hypothetical protein
MHYLARFYGHCRGLERAKKSLPNVYVFEGKVAECAVPDHGLDLKLHPPHCFRRTRGGVQLRLVALASSAFRPAEPKSKVR